jgi:hypothetical protein
MSGADKCHIALGFLVDVPMVSDDRCKRGLADGILPSVAPWLGPTTLASAIFFATIANVIAFLPVLMTASNTDQFLRGLSICEQTLANNRERERYLSAALSERIGRKREALVGDLSACIRPGLQ